MTDRMGKKKKDNPIICYLKEIHHRFKDTFESNEPKVKGYKKICQAICNNESWNGYTVYYYYWFFVCLFLCFREREREEEEVDP